MVSEWCQVFITEIELLYGLEINGHLSHSGYLANIPYGLRLNLHVRGYYLVPMAVN